MTRRIVAMGGASLRPETYDPRLGAFVLSLARRERPRVCFVATASGDSPESVANFHRAFSGHHDCEPSDLGLFERTVADLRAFGDELLAGGSNRRVPTSVVLTTYTGVEMTFVASGRSHPPPTQPQLTFSASPSSRRARP